VFRQSVKTGGRCEMKGEFAPKKPNFGNPRRKLAGSLGWYAQNRCRPPMYMNRGAGGNGMWIKKN
jgi:hypothetical protein